MGEGNGLCSWRGRGSGNDDVRDLWWERSLRDLAFTFALLSFDTNANFNFKKGDESALHCKHSLEFSCWILLVLE